MRQEILTKVLGLGLEQRGVGLRKNGGEVGVRRKHGRILRSRNTPYITVVGRKRDNELVNAMRLLQHL